MSAPEPDLSAALREIWLSHVELNRERMRAIEEAVASIESGRTRPAIAKAGEENAHKMAGAAGSFGYTEITQLSREIEEALQDPQRADARGLRHKYERLKRLFEATL